MGTIAVATGTVALMRLRLLAIGNKMPAWVTAGFQDFAKRLPPSYTLQLIEIPAEKRLKNSNLQRVMEKEGEKMLQAIAPGNLVVALDLKGQPWSTAQVAENLQQWHAANQPVDLLIGGPEGLAPACRLKAHLHWSLSPLTLPHPLVRIIVAEQLYRAYSILQRHPYHR